MKTQEVEFYINGELENEAFLKDRKGGSCDICEKDVPTEKFIGYCGSVLYICSRCLSKLK